MTLTRWPLAIIEDENKDKTAGLHAIGNHARGEHHRDHSGGRDFKTREHDWHRQRHACSSGHPSDQDTVATVREYERIFSNDRARIASVGDPAAKRSPTHSLVSIVQGNAKGSLGQRLSLSRSRSEKSGQLRFVFCRTRPSG